MTSVVDDPPCVRREAYIKKTPFPMHAATRPVVVSLRDVFKSPTPSFDFEVEESRGDNTARPPAGVRAGPPVSLAPSPPTPRVVVPFRGTTEYTEQYPRKEAPRDSLHKVRGVDDCLAASVPRPYEGRPQVCAARVYDFEAGEVRLTGEGAQAWVARTGTPYELDTVDPVGHVFYRRGRRAVPRAV